MASLSPNPSTRCEYWHFMLVPIHQERGNVAGWLPWAATTLTASLLSPTRDPLFTAALATRSWWCLPLPCQYQLHNSKYDRGHSFYFPLGTSAAFGVNDPTECIHLGYYRDGLPVYGLCQDAEGPR